jgi:hypothetical protein
MDMVVNFIEEILSAVLQIMRHHLDIIPGRGTTDSKTQIADLLLLTPALFPHVMRGTQVLMVVLTIFNHSKTIF